MTFGAVWRTFVPYVVGVTVFFVLMGITDEWSARNFVLGAVGMGLGVMLAVALYQWRVRRHPNG